MRRWKTCRLLWICLHLHRAWLVPRIKANSFVALLPEHRLCVNKYGCHDSAPLVQHSLAATMAGPKHRSTEAALVSSRGLCFSTVGGRRRVLHHVITHHQTVTFKRLLSFFYLCHFHTEISTLVLERGSTRRRTSPHGRHYHAFKWARTLWGEQWTEWTSASPLSVLLCTFCKVYKLGAAWTPSER